MVVLDKAEVQAKVSRMAWQIYEEFYREESIILAGIAQRGYQLARLLARELENISELRIDLRLLYIDKEQPLQNAPRLEPAQPDFENRSVVVIDDVLKSGATLIYGVRFFLDFPVKAIKTAVLVDRSHKRFPVKADFKGLSLSTSLQEHVNVHLEGEIRVEVS